MNEINYWLFRCENKLITTIHIEEGNIFPKGSAADFGNPTNTLYVGEWLSKASPGRFPTL